MSILMCGNSSLSLNLRGRGIALIVRRIENLCDESASRLTEKRDVQWQLMI